MPPRRGQGPRKVKGGRAICHPRRVALADGLCRECYKAQSATFLKPSDRKKTQQQLAKLQETDGYLESLFSGARAQLLEDLPEYATLMMQAARLAAAKGDARPAEQALRIIKAAGIKPVVEEAPKAVDAGGGFKVFIGVKIGNMPDAENMTAEVVEAAPQEITE